MKNIIIEITDFNAPELDIYAHLTEAQLLKETAKLAVILCTEGDGLCDKTIEASDYIIKIPMSHGVDSLNVASASAVAFWELGK